MLLPASAKCLRRYKLIHPCSPCGRETQIYHPYVADRLDTQNDIKSCDLQKGFTK